jgi:shikimate kinase
VTRRILLIGMMGAGKTTVGRLTAAQLDWAYFDSDAEVESDTGLTVPELFAAQGEEAFRDAESRALERACASEVPCVVSVAGGAVLREENRRRIATGGTVVWLRAEVETLSRRVGDGAGRPLLGGDPEEALRILDSIRRPLYADLADLAVDVDDRTAADVAAEIVTVLGT